MIPSADNPDFDGGCGGRGGGGYLVRARDVHPLMGYPDQRYQQSGRDAVAVEGVVVWSLIVGTGDADNDNLGLTIGSGDDRYGGNGRYGGIVVSIGRRRAS